MCVLIYMYILFFWLVATCAIMLNVYSINIISVVFRIQSHRHSTSNRKLTCPLSVLHVISLVFVKYIFAVYLCKYCIQAYSYIVDLFYTISSHFFFEKMNEGCLKFKIYILLLKLKYILS